nr:transaldolase family protein [Arthrobacter hankyongi]
MTTFNGRWACDVLRPVSDATGGVDGRVSIEIDPRLAHDTEAALAEARALWWMVDRENLFIKIPAACQGLPAIAGCLAEGISIYDDVRQVLERLAKVGIDYGEVVSKLEDDGVAAFDAS